ncbi:hypothetical protein MMC28_008576 [Mycoblastus sanguinarius]|nr:hypothetical protein [Mycoblastus sanguinarius]
MLWLLLRPGTDVYLDTQHDGHLNAYVIESLSGGMKNGIPKPVHIRLWNLNSNGVAIGRRKTTTVQAPFDGEKQVTALEVFPCSFFRDDPTAKEFTSHRKRLEDRGKMFFRLTIKQCMNYSGVGLSYPKQNYSGVVMVDAIEYYVGETKEIIPIVGMDDVARGISQCLCHVCLKYKDRTGRMKASAFTDYDFIIPKKTKELTSHQYFLCPPGINAYVFSDRAWDVFCFSDPIFDTRMIDTLVMADERRHLIKALAKNYDNEGNLDQRTSHRSWTADFVQGKGEGKIFLLHGKPGVGKTYTAECIAQFTKRPLLSLTVSDIGTDPTTAEENLLLFFKRAERWDAILLIDKADIFMERRENQDLDRNSLVSGFLRAMESCKSILFLTTNRVGSFDDAFISRIHVSLYYPDFTELDRKKVWQMFFDKLIRERGDIMRVPIETKDYTKGKEVKELRWNGREIRNAFQTAVALAEFESAKDEEGKTLLKESHIMQIVRMSKEFKTYLRELHRGDEAKRADRQRIRYDEFDPAGEEE